MMHSLRKLIDAIFPPRKSEILLRESTGTAPATIQNAIHREVFYLCSYQDAYVQALIIENKFHRNPTARRVLAQLVSDWSKQQPANLIFIPIPLSSKRYRARGFNQVTEVLNELCREKNYQVDDTILTRPIDTMPQTELQKEARLKNVIGVFDCPKPERLHNFADKTVVLIDDVVTTGATMEVARATLAPLLPSSTKLVCLALAH